MLLLESNIELFITNVGFVLSILMTLGMGVLVLVKAKDKKVSIPFFLFTISYSIFMFTHIWGINASSPERALSIFMFNMQNLMIAALVTHWIIAGIGKMKRWWPMVVFFYVLAAALIILFLSFPRSFLEGVQPILYFPHYYIAGPFYLIQSVFQIVAAVFVCIAGILAYREEVDLQKKKRILYFIIAPLIGYPIGLLPSIPVYGYQIDPILSIFNWFWLIPMVYGIIKEDLLDIRVIAKKATLYFLLIIVSTIGLIVINIANIFLLESYSNFPLWFLPFISSFFGIGIGFLVWKRVRESDILKYEFINVVTHKFRTPMTYIKFSIDELRANPGKETEKAAVDRIEIANGKLIELTNLLVQTSQSEEEDYAYARKETNLNGLIEEILRIHRGDIAGKLITLEKKLDLGLPTVLVDVIRIKSVLQIIIENALMYSPKGKTVTITTSRQGKSIVFSVKDEGIGIKPSELPLIFSKFFRTREATSVDTEGMGIGLFIARNIVRRNGGKIWVTSEGENKGSTFYVSLKTTR